MVKILLQQEGFDMYVGDNHGNTGFHLACFYGSRNVVQFLLQQGFDWNFSNYQQESGFYLACEGGELDIVQFLLRQGFQNINEIGSDGMNGLEILISNRYDYDEYEILMPCILLLIENGSQFNEIYVFDELISTIKNRIIEITFMKEIIFEKWTGRIAHVIFNFTAEPFTNTNSENLSEFLNYKC